MVLKLNQVEICNVGSLLCWTMCKVKVLRSHRECSNEYEDLVR